MQQKNESTNQSSNEEEEDPKEDVCHSNEEGGDMQSEDSE